MEAFLSTETLVIELLLIVSLVAIAVRRLRVPYTVALVIVGLLLTTQEPLDLSFTPEVILALLVPPLVFEAAFHINVRQLGRNLPGILLLAIPGVVITTLIVGYLVGALTPLSLPLALVFGALISATDPVAVVAMFRTLGAPRRLALIVESESLFNDGTAIVVFNLVVAAAITGAFDPVHGLAQFVFVSVGGLVVGLALGWLIAALIARIDDYLIETTLTTVLAYGAYLLAERLHFSGVLAVVAAGLVVGSIGSRGMSPTTRIVLFNFWEYVAFLANSLVFILIGLQVSIPLIASHWQAVLAAILAVLVSRAIVVYGLGWLGGRLGGRFGEPIPVRWLHVLNWGGLRGAIALALALSLPAALGADRELVQVMAFGVVLFTLVVQSMTMRPLLRRLGILERDPVRMEYQTRHARMIAFRAAALQLESMHRDGLLSENTWEVLRPQLAVTIERLGLDVRDLQQAHPGLANEELADARRELLRAQRGALQTLQRDGGISEEVYEKLVSEVDARLSQQGGDDDAPQEAGQPGRDRRVALRHRALTPLPPRAILPVS